jgi:hypothetical protein
LQIVCGAHPFSYTCSFCGVRPSRLEAHDSLPYIDMVQNEWKPTSILPSVIMSWCFTEYGDNSTFFFNFTCFHSLNTTTLSSICHPFLLTIVQLDCPQLTFPRTRSTRQTRPDIVLGFSVTGISLK